MVGKISESTAADRTFETFDRCHGRGKRRPDRLVYGHGSRCTPDGFGAFMGLALLGGRGRVGRCLSLEDLDATSEIADLVLPFINESGNSDVEYLSDGMTESLINSLSQLPNLAVKARGAVFRYKGRDLAPQQV